MPRKAFAQIAEAIAEKEEDVFMLAGPFFHQSAKAAFPKVRKDPYFTYRNGRCLGRDVGPTFVKNARKEVRA